MAAKKDSKKSERPEQVTIPHEREPGFRSIFADGTMVRTSGGTVVLTFFEDELVVRSQSGRRIDLEGGAWTYEFSKIEEEPVRKQMMAVRLRPQDAAALAALLVDRLQRFHPEALPDTTVEKVNKR